MSTSVAKIIHPSKETSFGLIEKIFVWSIILEPLLFFVVAAKVGVGGNISRVLQFVVISCLLIRVLMRPYSSIKIFNPLHYYYRWYFIYFSFLILSLFFGYFVGAYEVNKEGINASSLLNNSLMRPIFEHFVTIYYFIYFAVLPFFLLRSKKGIDYFFKIFFIMFFLCITLGLIDYALVVLFDYELLPRHISDFRHVGKRFHGIAGEPRDAFVLLFFGIALLYLKEIWTGIKFNRILIPLILICALLTQSLSGFLGLLMASGLIIIYQIPKMKLSYILLTIIAGSVLAIGIVLAISNSTRVMLYIESAPIAFEALQNGLELPDAIMQQMNNIYPLWIRWTEIIQMNLMPSFIGTGLGTASIANGYINPEGGVLNPHANIIRVLFESGVIGTFLYIAAFLQPCRKLSKLITRPAYLLFPMLLMIGVSFGHRSSTLYIFLGIVILVFYFKQVHETNSENEINGT